jgi:hypothetical protein
MECKGVEWWGEGKMRKTKEGKQHQPRKGLFDLLYSCSVCFLLEFVNRCAYFKMYFLFFEQQHA